MGFPPFFLPRSYSSERLWRREEGHEDHGGEKCACAGGETDHPFTIDCTDTTTIRAAATTLDSCTATDAGCKDATPNSDGVLVCNQAFLILQAHHDYCEHDTLLAAEELQVHDFEAVCVNCEVDRSYGANLQQCEEIGHCLCDAAGESTSAAMAALAVLDTDCTANGGASTCCSTTATQNAFRTVVAYHDHCGHDLPEAIEDGLHNYEGACFNSFCNIATAPFDPNDATACDAPTEEPHDDHAGEPCGCAGGEADHPFTIDCTDTATIRAAATTLGGCTATDAGCKDATPVQGVLVCNQAFLILQAHHDYCEHDTLLAAEELQVHDFEAFCVKCEVDRVYDENQAECAAISECECEDAGMTTSAATAALAVLDTDCTANTAGCCASVDTQNAFLTVVAYHDRCGHDLPEVIEDGLHNYEDACEDYFCRTATAVFDPNFCADAPTNGATDNGVVLVAGGGATATNTQVITVSFPVDFSDLDDASTTGIATSAKTELCTVLSRQNITCDVAALVVVVAAGTTAGTTTVAVTLPAGTNDDQAAAVATDISATPITVTVGGMSATSTGASKTSSPGSADSAASAGAQAFPALVLVLGAAMLL